MTGMSRTGVARLLVAICLRAAADYADRSGMPGFDGIRGFYCGKVSDEAFRTAEVFLRADAGRYVAAAIALTDGGREWHERGNIADGCEVRGR